MSQPFVSICIPVYNGLKHLNECLDSCLNQQYANYEIIICDDGSHDKSTELIEDYARKHSKIRFFRNEKNLGLVGNWNRCLDHAKGEWIKFVFQDDYITPDCLQVFLESVQPGSLLLVSERHFVLPDQPTEEQFIYYNQKVRTLKNTNQNTQSYFPPGLLSHIAVQNMCMNFIGEPSLTFFKKECVQQLGNFNAILKQICDLEFVLRVGSTYGLTYVPKKICAFRIHSESTTSTNISNRYFELHYVEPVLFAYLLLYDAHFENFRKNLTPFLSFKLHVYFKVKTYRAFKMHQVQKHDHYLFNGSHAGIKEISAASRPNLVTRLLERFL